jgi:hypothetical protein
VLTHVINVPTIPMFSVFGRLMLRQDFYAAPVPGGTLVPPNQSPMALTPYAVTSPGVLPDQIAGNDGVPTSCATLTTVGLSPRLSFGSGNDASPVNQPEASTMGDLMIGPTDATGPSATSGDADGSDCLPCMILQDL